MIEILSPTEVRRARETGALVAAILHTLRGRVTAGTNLLEIDRWVRSNTTDCFGPVRAVAPELVFEVAFDAVAKSTRHKSGVAMRFPRVSRLRWDKPPSEADRLETLEKLIGG